MEFCYCSHEKDEHKLGGLLQPCQVDDCDCDDYDADLEDPD